MAKNQKQSSQITLDDILQVYQDRMYNLEIKMATVQDQETLCQYFDELGRIRNAVQFLKK